MYFVFFQKMRLLAIDPSLRSTGFAYRSGGELYTGTINPAPLKGSARLHYIVGAIARIVAYCEPELVAYEGYAMGIKGGGRAFDMGELGGVLKHHLWVNGKGVLIVPPSSLKMFVTGKGNAKKEAVAARITAELGYVLPTDDESDAVGLLMVCEAFSGQVLLDGSAAGYRRKALGGCQLIPARNPRKHRR